MDRVPPRGIALAIILSNIASNVWNPTCSRQHLTASNSRQCTDRRLANANDMLGADALSFQAILRRRRERETFTWRVSLHQFSSKLASFSIFTKKHSVSWCPLMNSKWCLTIGSSRENMSSLLVEFT